jgi:hypothetical protein
LLRPGLFFSFLIIFIQTAGEKAEHFYVLRSSKQKFNRIFLNKHLLITWSCLHFQVRYVLVCSYFSSFACVLSAESISFEPSKIYIGNVLDLYLGSAWFQSCLGYQLSLQGIRGFPQLLYANTMIVPHLATIISFQILSNSWFICNPSVRRYIAILCERLIAPYPTARNF